MAWQPSMRHIAVHAYVPHAQWASDPDAKHSAAWCCKAIAAHNKGRQPGGACRHARTPAPLQVPWQTYLLTLHGTQPHVCSAISATTSTLCSLLGQSKIHRPDNNTATCMATARRATAQKQEERSPMEPISKPPVAPQHRHHRHLAIPSRSANHLN